MMHPVMPWDPLFRWLKRFHVYYFTNNRNDNKKKDERH